MNYIAAGRYYCLVDLSIFTNNYCRRRQFQFSMSSIKAQIANALKLAPSQMPRRARASNCKWLAIVVWTVIVGCQPLHAQEGSQSNTQALPLCEAIKEIAVNENLNEITVDDEFVDIDNDGIKEQIAYVPTRTYYALIDVSDGENYALPSGSPDALYSGASIIRLNDKNYVLHFSSAQPSELIELVESDSADRRRRYNPTTLCSFNKSARPSLQNICQELSERYGYAYELISGEVLGAEVYPPRGMDCFHEPRGCLNGQATFMAKIKIVDSDEGAVDEEIAVYTKLEPQNELYAKPPYMKVDANYMFCARPVAAFEFIEERRQAKMRKYKIDFVNTIQLLH